MLRPTSVRSSDLCQLSSPPSLPSASSVLGQVRQGPTTCEDVNKASIDSLPLQEGVFAMSSTRPKHVRASPILPLREPTRYVLELGACRPIYDEEAKSESLNVESASSSHAWNPMSPAHVEPSGLAAPVGLVSEPSGLFCSGVPPNLVIPGPMKEDPGYPGVDGDPNDQCCNCGEEVELSTNPFVCAGFVADGTERCLHVTCNACRTSDMFVC